VNRAPWREKPDSALACGQRHENVRQSRVRAEARHQTLMSIAPGSTATLADASRGKGNSPSERQPFRIALLDSGHRLAGYPVEGGRSVFSGRAPQPVDQEHGVLIEGLLRPIDFFHGAFEGAPVHMSLPKRRT
jgi:hypothetical protein